MVDEGQLKKGLWPKSQAAFERPKALLAPESGVHTNVPARVGRIHTDFK